MITINLDSVDVRNRLTEIATVVGKPRPVLQASARSLRRELQRHFAEKNRTPNRLGGRRTNFWSQIRSSTQIGKVTDVLAEVVIGDPRFAQKLRGGPIKAKEAGALTIPMAPEAHGRRPKVLEQALGIKLFVIGARIGQGAYLAAARAEGEGIKVYYALKKRVIQKADPTALPPMDVMAGAVREGAESYLRGVIVNEEMNPNGGGQI